VLLTIQPTGRGNWRPVVITWPDNDQRTLPMHFAVGDVWTIGGRMWRLLRVEP
jgi:hypothetical protein